MATVLVVEDEAPIREGLVDALAHEGHVAREAADGPAALTAARAERPDLILLDLMIPGCSGFEVCRRLRAEGSIAPIIMLTAKGAEADVLAGLEAGADDYVTKPFSVKQLMARIAAQLRRGALDFGAKLDLDGAVLDLDRCELTRDGAVTPLTRREADLIRYFLRHRHRAVTRQELLTEVWGYATADLETRTVDIHVAKLRQKLEPQPARPRYILTVREQGYMWGGGPSSAEC